MNVSDANTKRPEVWLYLGFIPCLPFTFFPPLEVVLSEQCLHLSQIFSHGICNPRLKEEGNNLPDSHQALSHPSELFSILTCQ